MKRAGFSSVFTVMIFASLMILFSTLFTHSLDKAAASIDESITVNAGTNILTEFNPKLFSEFGMLAHPANSDRLTKLADYYIRTGLSSKGTLVHSKLVSLQVSARKYNALDVNNFSKALDKAFIKMSQRGTERQGLSDFHGRTLPSEFLKKSWFFTYEDGIFSLGPEGLMLIQIQYIYRFFNEAEAEYILFGNADAGVNSNATFASVYAIRFIEDGIKDIEDPLALAAAIAIAYKETETVMNGGAVPILGTQGTLKDYLRYMMVLVPEDVRLARMMDIMQLSVGGDFRLIEYAFGCEITAEFRRGNKNGTITQTHCY